MYKYVIEGNHSLSGKIKASGNKNAALPCICATLLTDQTVVLKNIPEIADVKVMIDVIKELGVSVEKKSNGTYAFTAKNINTTVVPKEGAQKMRASILLAGPLLARCRQAILPPPGGDVIGRRRLDTHFLAFEALGASIRVDSEFKIQADKLVGTELFLDEASVTATENAIMVAVLSQGKTVISNAACEPHVQDLCHMLCAMGAKITGIGSNMLFIEGVEALHGAEFSIGADFMEVGSFIGLAAVTHSRLEIEDACPEHMKMTQLAFAKLGIHWEVNGNNIIVPAEQRLKVREDIGGAIPKIDDAPWPGFPTDLTSIMTVVASQVEGMVLIHEKLFETRMFFVDKLISMGARIVLCDPHRAVINGPSKLQGAKLSSPDVRAGMAMIIAALCAEGRSDIQNVYQIERGYEDIVGKLTSLGAHIEKVSV